MSADSVAPMRPTDEEMNGLPGGGAGGDRDRHTEPAVRGIDGGMLRARAMLS
jgi:hypothetical protein